MPYRGNGTWPPSWQTSTSPHSDLMQHEGRISALETTADQHHERLEDLETIADEFIAHRARPLTTIIQSRWAELVPFVIAASALLWGSRETAARLGWWLLGGGPD